MRRRALRLAALAALAAALAFGVAASGIVPIKASSRHWPATDWLLHFAMRRSVATHTLFTEVPPLDDPARVLRGAGHYEGGCAPCHGAPGRPLPVVPQRMTPHPPALAERIPDWAPEELFYVVRHGVKFTGMPAWPAGEREDEVWDVVAFLLALPGLDAAGYRRLVRPETPPEGAPPVVAAACARCHGADGGGRGRGAFPVLAGQRRAYLVLSLRAYARGERHSGIMQPIARGLDEAAIAEVADHYAGLPAPARAGPAPDPAARERGEAIAQRGDPSRKVPSCVDCHGPGDAPTDPAYPRLAGQAPGYLARQLELFRDGRRGGSPWSNLMHVFADQLTPEQIADVAHFYATLAPEPGRRVGRPAADDAAHGGAADGSVRLQLRDASSSAPPIGR